MPEATALPRLSVVTVSLNQGRYLERTLQSVREQTYPNIEHIVMDGGSTDQTLELLRRHERECPFPLQWRSEPDRGQGHACNKAFELASGEWLLYLNSADYFQAPDSVAKAMADMAGDPGHEVYAFAQWVLDEGANGPRKHLRYSEDDPALPKDRMVHAGPYSRWGKVLRYPLPHEATFFRRSVIERVGGYSEDFRMMVDVDLFCRILRYTSIRLMPHHRTTVFLLHRGAMSDLSYTQRHLWERFLARHRGGAPLLSWGQLRYLLLLVFPGYLRYLSPPLRTLERRLRRRARARKAKARGPNPD